MKNLLFLPTILFGIIISFLFGSHIGAKETMQINEHYLHTDTVYIHDCDSAIGLYLKHHGFKYPAPFLWFQPDTIQTRLLNDPSNWKFSTKGK